MTFELQPLIEAWDGLGVVVRYDQRSGAWMFIALHDDTLGPPTGGSRMKSYDSPAEALRDAMRLAEGMTCKWAAVDWPYGGGKGVMAVPPELPEDVRIGVLQRYGRLVDALHGGFGTGVDLGTTPEDMLIIARETHYVHGVDREHGTARDPGPYTARGVLRGICASVRHVHGRDDLHGCVVHIQGVGDVGQPLARLLQQAGAKLILSDLDADRADSLAQVLGADTVAADEAHTVGCDVYAPCAVGGALNAKTIPALKCRIVAGSANNQLEGPEDADRLHRRGILYAPDYVINAGGAIAFAMLTQGLTDEGALFDAIDRIDTSLTEIFAESKEREESPIQSAQRIVARRLERARQTEKGA